MLIYVIILIILVVETAVIVLIFIPIIEITHFYTVESGRG